MTRNLATPRRLWNGLLTVLLFCMATTTAWGAAAGEVTYVSGEAWIERGEKTLSISTGDQIEEGDAVVTRSSTSGTGWRCPACGSSPSRAAPAA